MSFYSRSILIFICVIGFSFGQNIQDDIVLLSKQISKKQWQQAKVTYKSIHKFYNLDKIGSYPKFVKRYGTESALSLCYNGIYVNYKVAIQTKASMAELLAQILTLTEFAKSKKINLLRILGKNKFFYLQIFYVQGLVDSDKEKQALNILQKLTNSFSNSRFYLTAIYSEQCQIYLKQYQKTQKYALLKKATQHIGYLSSFTLKQLRTVLITSLAKESSSSNSQHATKNLIKIAQFNKDYRQIDITNSILAFSKYKGGNILSILPFHQSEQQQNSSYQFHRKKITPFVAKFKNNQLKKLTVQEQSRKKILTKNSNLLKFIDSNYYASLANSSLKAKNYSLAIAGFKLLYDNFKWHPQHLQFIKQLIFLYEAVGNYNNTIKYSRLVIENKKNELSDSEKAKYTAILLRALLQKKQYQKVLNYVTSLDKSASYLQLEDSDRWIRYARIICLSELKEPQKAYVAIKAYLKKYQQKPAASFALHNQVVKFLQCVLAVQFEKPAIAIKLTKQYLADYPSNNLPQYKTIIQLNLLEGFYNNKQYQEVIATANKLAVKFSQQKNIAYARLQVVLAKALLKTADKKRALQLLDKLFNESLVSTVSQTNLNLVKGEALYLFIQNALEEKKPDYQKIIQLYQVYNEKYKSTVFDYLIFNKIIPAYLATNKKAEITTKIKTILPKMPNNVPPSTVKSILLQNNNILLQSKQNPLNFYNKYTLNATKKIQILARVYLLGSLKSALSKKNKNKDYVKLLQIDKVKLISYLKNINLNELSFSTINSLAHTISSKDDIFLAKKVFQNITARMSKNQLQRSKQFSIYQKYIKILAESPKEEAECKKILQLASKISKTNNEKEWIAYMLAYTAYRQNKFNQALLAIDKYITNEKFSNYLTQLYFYRAKTFQKQGKIDEAWADYNAVLSAGLAEVRFSAPAILFIMQQSWKRNNIAKKDRENAYKSGKQYVDYLKDSINKNRLKFDGETLNAFDQVVELTKKYKSQLP